jgi:hypothetical protein
MPLTSFLLLLPMCAVPGAEGASARSQSAGPVLVVEGGRHAGGLGLAAIYHQPLSGRPITLSGELGVGMSGAVPRAVAGAAGVAASYGLHHRGIIGLAWGALGRSTLSLHGTDVADRSLYGPGLEGGYEYVSDRGLVIRALAGMAYLSPSWQEQLSRFVPTLAVAFGWKLW